MATENILYKKEHDYSLFQILKSESSNNPHLDKLIVLNDIVRVCYENKIPFENNKLNRVFREIYRRNIHGSKAKCWEFLKNLNSTPQAAKKLPSFPLRINQKKPTGEFFHLNVLKHTKKHLEVLI